MPKVRTSREKLLRLLATWKPLDEEDALPDIEDLPPRDLNMEIWEAPTRRPAHRD